MKGVVQVKPLTEALELIRGVVRTSQSTLPMLAGVHLELRAEGQLRLRGTDLEQFLRVDVVAEVESPGVTLLPGAGRLLALVKTCQKGPLHIEVEEPGPPVLRSGGSRFTIASLTADDYPVEPEPTEAVAVQMMAKDVLWIIHKVGYAMSEDESRYALNGLRLAFAGRSVECTATDGHRLVRGIVGGNVGSVDPPRTILVPKTALKTMAGLLKRIDTITMQVSASMLVLETPDIRYGIRLLDGKFPDVESVIKDQTAGPIEAILPVAALTAAIRQAIVMTEHQARPVSLDFQKEGLVLRAQDPDTGEATVQVPDVTMTPAAEIKITFNARYLLDYLESVEGDVVIMRLKDGLSPIYLSGAEAPFSIIMPMRS